MDALVEVSNITKRFGNITAVDHISFAIKGGEVLGFLGPNGSGKTTTMRMVTGYLPPTGGRVVVCGFDIERRRGKAQERIGYLPEGAPLYEEMTPRGLLSFVCDVRGLKRARKRNASDEVVELFKLAPVLDQEIGTLSRGFKRRVALATAFVHEPQVLILDEPTDGLDPNQKYEVRRLIRHMARDENRAIIVSTHILEEVDAICTRAIIIARGRVVAEGTPDDLASKSPQHNAVHIRIAEDKAEGFRSTLLRHPSVDRVEEADNANGKVHLIAVPLHGKGIVGQVSGLAKTSDVRIEEIYTVRGHLDDAFREVTRGVQAASPGPNGKASKSFSRD